MLSVCLGLGLGVICLGVICYLFGCYLFGPNSEVKNNFFDIKNLVHAENVNTKGQTYLKIFAAC